MRVARRYDGINQIPITLDGVAATFGDLKDNEMYMASLVAEGSEKLFLMGRSPRGILHSLMNTYMADRDAVREVGYEIQVSALPNISASSVAGRGR